MGDKSRPQRGLCRWGKVNPTKVSRGARCLNPLNSQSDPGGEPLSFMRRPKCRHFWPLSGLLFLSRALIRVIPALPTMFTARVMDSTLSQCHLRSYPRKIQQK